MTEKELLEFYNLSLCEFHPDEWGGTGFIVKEINTIFVNSSLDEVERKKLLLHEIGHLDHYESLYKHAPLVCENQADSFMIGQLVAEEVAEYGIEAFDKVRFMDKHRLKTTTEEVIIEKEIERIYYG